MKTSYKSYNQFIVKCGIFLAVIFCLQQYCCAQILINRSKEKYTVKPGSIVTDTISVSSSGKANSDVRVYFEDFRYVAPFDGAKEFLRPGALENSCSKWLSFSPQDFTIAPYQTQTVSYSLKVPADIKDGGYYGVLFFETMVFKPSEKDMGMGVSERIGCLFFLETQDKLKRTGIEDIRINNGKFEADFITASNVIVIPAGVYYILSEDGMVAARGEIPKFYLPFEARVPFFIDLPENIARGNYTMVITFDLGDEDTLIKEIELSYDSSKGYQILKVSE